MSALDLKTIAKIMETMIHFELSLSDFYTKCGEVWDEDRAFWRIFANAEVGHAANIQKMLKIITQRPEHFEIGRPFNLVALNTAMAGITENTRRLSMGEFTRAKTLFIARDIEQSVLESYYAEIVKTTDVEYQNLMKEILSQTYEHRKMIQEKIDAIKMKG